MAISGSCTAELTGRAANEEIAIDGSGDVRAAKVAARKARVQVNGSGDIDVKVADELDAQVNGSGNVVYRGNPRRVPKRANGSGSIRGG